MAVLVQDHVAVLGVVDAPRAVHDDPGGRRVEGVVALEGVRGRTLDTVVDAVRRGIRVRESQRLDVRLRPVDLEVDHQGLEATVRARDLAPAEACLAGLPVLLAPQRVNPAPPQTVLAVVDVREGDAPAELSQQARVACCDGPSAGPWLRGAPRRGWGCRAWRPPSGSARSGCGGSGPARSRRRPEPRSRPGARADGMRTCQTSVPPSPARSRASAVAGALSRVTPTRARCDVDCPLTRDGGRHRGRGRGLGGVRDQPRRSAPRVVHHRLRPEHPEPADTLLEAVDGRTAWKLRLARGAKFGARGRGRAQFARHPRRGCGSRCRRRRQESGTPRRPRPSRSIALPPPLNSYLHDHRQHHRPPPQALVHEAGDVVVQVLLEQARLALLVTRGVGE